MTDGTATGVAEPLHRLLHRSHSRIPHDGREAAIADVFPVARSSNARIGVTGALLLTDHWFAQVLEGLRGSMGPTSCSPVRPTDSGDARLPWVP